MLSMIAVAVPFLALAVVFWLLAGRIDLKRKIQSWSGERTTVPEAQSARTRIMILRAATAACVLAAVLGVGAVSLLQAYAAR